MKKRYESELLMVCHQTAEDLYRAGVISDAEMQEFDADCLITDPEESSTALVPAAPDYASV
ncbi:hypothetical protein FACS1894164_16680 [Spirochaetia bacterium]|nr:hypothetical protein FACS1894164_16680 [Spirochaetia bacterium]